MKENIIDNNNYYYTFGFGDKVLYLLIIIFDL